MRDSVISRYRGKALRTAFSTIVYSSHLSKKGMMECRTVRYVFLKKGCIVSATQHLPPFVFTVILKAGYSSIKARVRARVRARARDRSNFYFPYLAIGSSHQTFQSGS